LFLNLLKKMKKNNRIIFQILLIIFSLVVTFQFTKNNRMSDNWMGPYLSFASNLKIGDEFKIDINEIKEFKSLSTKEQDFYKFKKSEKLELYNHNPVGYAYFIKISNIMFPFLGNQLGIILLQGVFHVIFCFLILNIKDLEVKYKYIFLFMYGINPLILKFVVFNFYYYFQAIPSLILVYYYFRNKTNLIEICLFGTLIGLVLLTRLTTLFTITILVYLVFKKFSKIYTILFTSLILIIFFSLNQPIKKSVWFTAYVGYGAYQNEDVKTLSDNEAYSTYFQETGNKIKASVGGNYYDDKIIDQFDLILKQKTTNLFLKNPLIFLKNATLNFTQSFSIGYINMANDIINIFISISGLFVLLILLAKRDWFWIFAIMSVSIGFVVYYPPIQAYMYGAYLLIITALYLNMITKNSIRKSILYISTNDGSDMRINKEIKSLSKQYDITFIGIGLNDKNAFVKDNCTKFIMLNGDRRKLIMWFKLTLKVYQLIFFSKSKFNSIHIINEPTLFLIYPVYFLKHTVLDLFDSMFLKTSKKGIVINLLQKFLYLPINIIIVTDQNRKNILSQNISPNRIQVVENFPNKFEHKLENKVTKLTIFYNGWMGKGRGTEIIRNLISKYDVDIWMAGWFADKETEELSKLENVQFLGVLTQTEALKKAQSASYILCLYEPSNNNNINASPNKIYDAIQVNTPVIINNEVKVASFVKENNLGIIIDNYYKVDLDKLNAELIAKMNTFDFPEILKNKYSWENIEHTLLECHS